MKDSQFWNPYLYYLVWLAIVGSSAAIAVNIYFWERFVSGFKVRLSTFIKWLAATFSIYNAGLMALSQFGYVVGYWLWFNRAASIAAIPICLAVVMTFINIRSYRANAKGRKNIEIGYRLMAQEVAMTSRERERTAIVTKQLYANIHSSHQ